MARGVGTPKFEQQLKYSFKPDGGESAWTVAWQGLNITTRLEVSDYGYKAFNHTGGWIQIQHNTNRRLQSTGFTKETITQGGLRCKKTSVMAEGR